MCGIAGIVNIGHLRNQEQAITAMTNCVAHRGPDAEGFYIDENIALGHRRLSIIDLSTLANQPMSDATGRYTIIFNGEIYNYKEVKSQLPDYPYKTKSDSEVLLAAYSKWGIKCLDKLNGMFAFAIWDKLEKKLILARDRLGKKPLYYFLTKDYFVFGSEVRALLSSGLVSRKLNEEYLSEFLMFQAPIGSHSLVKDLKQLEAGHFGVLSAGIFEKHSYWNYEHIQPSTDNYETAKKNVRDLFEDAVKVRMISDVPIGAFLSGGIDSSLIVSCMASLSQLPIETFSISFDEKEYDESAYAERVAEIYKTNHLRIVLRSDEFLHSTDEILSAMDSPSGDGHNTYIVAKYTRQSGIKVALSGLGGDELFVGYNKFMLYHRIMRNKWWLGLPFIIRKPLASIIHSISKDHKKNKLADVLQLSHWDLATIYPELRNSFRKAEAEKLVIHHQAESLVHHTLKQIEKHAGWMGEFSKCTIGEMETYTRDILLRDTDQMAMAHALEVRAPFLDYRLLEYVLSLPDEYKYPHSPKKLLVDAFESKLPDDIVNRKKMGFSFPMDRWFRKDLAEMVRTRITYLADRKEFNGTAIMNLLSRFNQHDKQVTGSKIWQLVVLSDWLERNQL